jgi:hypothetical protein
MNNRTIGIFFSPWNPYLSTASAKRSRNPLTMYRRAFWYKANPRDVTYMKRLFTEHFQEGMFINVDEDPLWRDKLSDVDTVALLYPDAIGQGFYRLENEVQRKKRKSAAMRALNGRRRGFLLTRSTLLGLRIRRILERWMVGELMALILFVLITPVFLLKDLLRGHR